MKRKEWIITVIICIICIFLGTIGFSFLYQILFQPEKLVEEYPENEEWVQEKEEQEKEILYPFLVWKEKEIIDFPIESVWEIDYEGF